MRSRTIGLLGLGTVGQALVSIIQKSYPELQIAKALVQDVHRKRTVSIPLTTRPEEVLTDPAIDLVVEVMGGREPYRWIIEALQSGKDVVTANKELMAYHGPELLAVARESGRQLLYEAAVAGGIPILDALAQHLSVVPIQRIEGVLNGTCNFILSHMEQDKPYAAALAEAQRLGYAEADPTADVRGDDTARKILLLARIGFHLDAGPETVDTVGITALHDRHLARLKTFQLGVRLVGSAWLDQGQVSLMVAPTVYRIPHPFLALEGPGNAIKVISEAGSFWFQGPGAGGYATATSILSDVVRIGHQEMALENLSHQPYSTRAAAPFYVTFTEDPDRRLPLGLPGEIRRVGSYAIVESGFSEAALEEYGLCQFVWGEAE